LELEKGKRAIGIKNVTISEDFFTHHFPHAPIMPGTLITEALVQLADWIIREHSDFRQMGMAVSFDKLKFHRMAQPGDQLRLEVEIVSLEAGKAQVKGKAYCNDQVVTAAHFSLECTDIEPYLLPEDARKLFAVLRR